jgi:hypothetical protein
MINIILYALFGYIGFVLGIIIIVLIQDLQGYEKRTPYCPICAWKKNSDYKKSQNLKKSTEEFNRMVNDYLEGKKEEYYNEIYKKNT